MLNWERFKTLPGQAAINFEKLCRGIVRRHFGSQGPLHELKNQPGVEYYIQLNKDHARLGEKDDIVGWQCKWFQYNANKNLSASAKSQIVHSLEKTVEHVPDLKHWILWTHQTLTKVDQEWYYDLKVQYGFELYLWNEDDLDELLSGPAIDLRQSYFDELALTADMLAEQHKKSVAPVLSRWVHEAHQQMQLEHKARQVLGEPQAWVGFADVHSRFEKVISLINEAIIETEYSQWNTEIQDFATSCKMFSEICTVFYKSISGENLAQIDEFLQISENFSKHGIHIVLRRLRRANLPLALIITDALAYIKDIKELLATAHNLLANQFVAVVADAGGGKTQFSAEITAPRGNRPAGILLLGRALKSGGNLDTLVQTFIFYGQRVNNFEALISAVDSAGDRENCRLPIVIDGLNEAQDPRDWKPLLASILPVLKKYPNVVLICTLRTGERLRHYRNSGYSAGAESRECFARQALPDNSKIIESEGFDEGLTLKAIRAYFKLYKIEANPFSAPQDFFSHPLNLKIFCEVTNPKAEKTVQVNHFPSSVYSLFRQQMLYMAATIANMTNLARRYQESDIEKALYFLGKTLWEAGTRSVSEELFRKSSGYTVKGWEEDVVNLLAQEGILFRDNGDSPYDYLLTPVYDRLGGYLIADYLLKLKGNQEYSSWMQSENFIKVLFGDLKDQHELSEDILYALISLAPKDKRKQQVWQALPDKYAPQALSLSHLIDRDDFCDDTRESYKALVKEEKLHNKTLEQLRSIRRVVGHPLNADFLSEVLFELSVVDRDLSWTEDNRMHHKDIIDSLEYLVSEFKKGYMGSSEADRLRMVSISWLLTSTVIDLRDIATEVLFLYGLNQPENLFSITKKMLTVNDPYVSERLLAASYGVVTSMLLKGGKQQCIQDFAQFIYDQIFTGGAKAATTHLLGRDYASSILQVVATKLPGLAAEWKADCYIRPFTNMARVTWGVSKEKEDSSRIESPFRMDFENYTIGRLIPGRSNYDYDNPEYKQVRSKILWRIKQLGWDAELFGNAEKRVESMGGYSRGDLPKIERYGKKYSWIAYYEMAGKLSDEGKLEYYGEERFATDIDPFFPDELVKASIDKKLFIGDTQMTTAEWINGGDETGIECLLLVDDINGVTGPWVLVDAFISEESKKLDRNFYCAIDASFIPVEMETTLKEYKSQGKKINWPNKDKTRGLYSGEIYWKPSAVQDSINTIDVVVGQTQKHIEQPHFELNGVVLSEGGMKQVSTPVIKSIEARPIILEYYWENTGGRRKSLNHILLAPWVVAALNLDFNPTKLNFVDQEGLPAAVFIDCKDNELSNYRQLTYMRKEHLDSLSENAGLVLLRDIHGERRYANSRANTKDSLTYKTFNYLQLGSSGGRSCLFPKRTKQDHTSKNLLEKVLEDDFSNQKEVCSGVWCQLVVEVGGVKRRTEMYPKWNNRRQGSALRKLRIKAYEVPQRYGVTQRSGGKPCLLPKRTMEDLVQKSFGKVETKKYSALVLGVWKLLQDNENLFPYEIIALLYPALRIIGVDRAHEVSSRLIGKKINEVAAILSKHINAD